MSKTHSGKKVVIVLLGGMAGAAATVTAIANSFGSQPGAETRQPKSTGTGGSMWKNIDSEMKAKKQGDAEPRSKPAAPW